ncbi:MAG: putative pyridoxal-dependent aspartate 1-decarboxylase [Blastocatellia bacterium]
MTSAKDTGFRSESSRNEPEVIEARLNQIFGNSDEAIACEQEFEARVSSIVNDFLLEKGTNSEVEFQSLQAGFKQSRLPLDPASAESYLEYLASNVISHSTRTSSPRFIGHMTSALPYFVRPLAKLMTAMNQNVVKTETSKAFTPYEREALAMVHRLIYDFTDNFYDQHIQQRESTLGMIVSGGTLANITALWCARNSALRARNDFTGIENEGLLAALGYYGYTDAVVIGSALMHYSFEKAADTMGLGTRNIIKIPVDSANRINLQALRQAVADCQAQKRLVIAIVGIAGTTDFGSIDPLSEMAEIAREAGIHFHVDAAWGGPVLFSERYQHKLAGLEKADSVTIDGHKQLYLPMGIGMVLLRDPHKASFIEKQARYIVRPGSYDLGKRSLEGSRPGMALFLHAALNIVGRKGYEFLIVESIRKTKYMADSIRARPEFELLTEPEINILTYRYIPAELREKVKRKELTDADNHEINRFNVVLQKAQREAGRTFVSRTLWNTGSELSIVALRVVIANPLTTESDIDVVLKDQIEIAASLMM